MNSLPTPVVTKVTAATTKPVAKPVAKATGPKWNNQNVVRSDQKDSGYHYNDWRQW